MSLITHEVPGYRYTMGNYKDFPGTVILKRYETAIKLPTPLTWIINDTYFPEVKKPNGNTLENYIILFSQYLKQCEDINTFYDISPLINSILVKPIEFEPWNYSSDDEEEFLYSNYSEDEETSDEDEYSEEEYKNDNNIENAYNINGVIVFTTNKYCQELLSSFTN